jgi:membrane-bound lytic murein transglycosylase F
MQTRLFTHLLAVVLLPLLIAACSQPENELQRIQQEGKLVVLTRNAATAYFEGPGGGPTGLEYDLASGFAEELGVGLEMVVASNVSEVLGKLAEGEADLAAAGLTITAPRESWARFSTPYQEITQQLVYRVGTRRPPSLDKLNGQLEIIARSSHAEQLQQLKSQHASLSWTENSKAESEELLTLVWEKVIDYTIADSNEVAMNRRFFPELRIAFDISEPQPLAWAFPPSRDDSLLQAANAYFERIEKSGRLARLIERYYGHLEDFDYVGTRTYMLHIRQRLPEYRAMFEYAASEFGVDWRLLAAMAYQESHWNPDAVSPTGVRGIMMLTNTTASELGVETRTDPVQSIRGGALYLSRLFDKIPSRIQEPDRSWLALAAYNIGFGHLEDARIITQQQGGDPDSWKAIKEHLPLLRTRKWYQQTRHGYARGNEAVRYVENIRSYYDILAWLIGRERPRPAPPSRALGIATPAL